MEKVVIHAELRSVTGKKVGALRRAGKLPGVIYGHNINPTPILMDLREASRALSAATSSSLITIDVGGKEHSTLVREKQLDFIRRTLLHIDFQAVSLTERIKSKVAITTDGISPAVDDFNGVIVTNISELTVEALPQDLPERFTVDISNLKEIGDAIYVRDILVGDNTTIMDDPDEVVIVVTASKEEEVVEEITEEEPEIIEKGKREEEAQEENAE